MPSEIAPFLVLGSILLLQTTLNIGLIYWVDRLSNRVKRLEDSDQKELLTCIEEMGRLEQQ